MNHKKSSKQTLLILSAIIIFLFSTTTMIAQENRVEKVEVPLTNPAKPVMLKAHLFSGSITVTGYAGKTVSVEAHIMKPLKKEKDQRDKKVDEKAKGMRRITPFGGGLNIEEQDNTVEIQGDWSRTTINLIIKVPVKSSLSLKAMQNGNIKVTGVSGDLEVHALHGSVTLDNVSGTVVADSLHEDVTVSFDRVNPEKPMSFSSLQGNLDVTFPANIKADLKLDTLQGEIYSDFDVAMKKNQTKVAKSDKKKGGKFKIKFDNTMYGSINGGGKEITFKSMSGNIYIRKKK